MVKRRRTDDSGGTTTAPAKYNSVFIDTNIDTHLVLLAADIDTLSNLKYKIVLEHGRCFPEIGMVKIHALKVKRKGFYYHVPDYMLVKSAFEGYNKSWFLYVDVSKCHDVLQIVNHGATNQSNKAKKLLGSHVESDPQIGGQEKVCASSEKDDAIPPASICSPGSHNSSHNDMQHIGELKPSEDGLEKRKDSALPSTLSDTKEVNVHKKHSKKRARSSKSEIYDDHEDQVRNLNADSHLVLPDTTAQKSPVSAKSKKGRSSSEEHDAAALGQLGSSAIPLHDEDSKGSSADFLVLLADVAASGHRSCKNSIEKGNYSSKTIDTDVATESGNCDGKKKKKKVSESGAAVKDQKDRESMVAEKYLNREQVPETQLSSNSDCPDVLEAFEVNEEREDGKAFSEKKKKQKVEKAVAGVQETVNMNQDAVQINDIVDSPEPDGFVPPINFKQYFVPSHDQEEGTGKPSASTVAKKKKEEFSESSKKDGIVSSASKANNLTESSRVTETKIPYVTTSSDRDEIRTPTKPVTSSSLRGSDTPKTAPRKKETVKSLATSGTKTRDRKESSLGHRVTTGKNSSSKLDGVVVNKSKQEKSLGQTPKAIFRDNSSESSSSEGGSVVF